MSRTVLILGGAGTLGQALAREAARRAWRVAIADLDELAGEALRESLVAKGVDSFFVSCDVRDDAALRQAVQRIARRWGSLDVLINVAGVATAGLFEAASDDDWQWQLDTTLLGAVRACRVAVSEMRRQGRGQILLCASPDGIAGHPGLAVHGAAQAALVHLAETLRAELAPLDIGVTLLLADWFGSGLATRLRAADPVSRARFARLLENGVRPEALARAALDGVERNHFLVLPRGAARRRWLRHRLQPKRLLADMTALARRLRR